MLCLSHANDAAPFGMDRVLNLVHKGTHVKDSSTSRVQQIIRVSRIGQLSGIESLPIVPDVNSHCILLSNESNIYLLVGGAFIAVHYCIDDRFVHRKLNPTCIVLIETNLSRYTFGN